MGLTLGWYFLRRSLFAFALVATVLTLLLFIFDVISEFDSVGSGSYDALDALLVVCLGTPKRMVEIAPFVCMLGIFYVLAEFNRTSELVAMRTAGLSNVVLVRTCLAAVLLVLAGFAVLESAARTLYADALKYRELERSGRVSSVRNQGLWFYDAGSIVNVETSPEGTGARHVRIFELADDERLGAYLYADSARRQGDGTWRLEDGRLKRYEEERIAVMDFQFSDWMPEADPASVLLDLPMDSLTLTQLQSQIAELEQEGEDPGLLRLQFWSRLAIPVQGLAFALLAAVISLGRSFRGDLGLRVMIGALTALVLFVVSQTITNAGLVLGVEPMVSVMLPALGVGVLALVLTRYTA